VAAQVDVEKTVTETVRRTSPSTPLRSAQDAGASHSYFFRERYRMET
jgi:hypothetical protein